MKRIRHIFAIITLMLLFLACGNKSRQAEPITYDDQPNVELSDSDTTSTTVQNKANRVEEIPSSPVKTSSNEYDNMRGFDPASEDDMDDNGMSRYMENNDEEGWD